MSESSKPPLSVPPFPPLRWNGYSWRGRVTLAAWQGFQSRMGAYAARSSAGESDGTVRLSVAAPGGVAEQPPAVEQANAFRYLLEHEEVIRDALVAAILEAYPRIRANWLQEPFADDEMPAIEQPEQLKAHIGLATLHVLKVTRRDAAYVGFEFGCTWDEEHGLGLMTHQGRIVELPHMGVGKVNGADLASEAWVAEEDARYSE